MQNNRRVAIEAIEPSPSEIAQRAAQVRRRWSPEERDRRAGIIRHPVEATPIGSGKRWNSEDFER